MLRMLKEQQDKWQQQFAMLQGTISYNEIPSTTAYVTKRRNYHPVVLILR